MGHWSETLVEEAARHIGIDLEANREALVTALEKAGREIEILAGRRFGVSERKTVTILRQPFPFAEIPDLQVDPGRSPPRSSPRAAPLGRGAGDAHVSDQPTPELMTSEGSLTDRG